MSDNNALSYRLLAQDQQTTVTGYYPVNKSNCAEHIVVKQLSSSGSMAVTTCLTCASNWLGFTTNAFLVSGENSDKYLLIAITDTLSNNGKRVLVYKYNQQNYSWYYFKTAEWVAIPIVEGKFKQWNRAIVDKNQLIAEGEFESEYLYPTFKNFTRTVVVDLTRH